MSRFKGNGVAKHPLIEKAELLAAVDYKVNGDFRNGPYNIIDENGEPHKAHVRMHTEQSGQRVYIEIVRPAKIVTTGVLWERPEDIPTRPGEDTPPDTVEKTPF